MKIRFTVILLALLVLFVFTTACSSSATTTAAPASTSVSSGASNGAALVQQRCSVCHPIARIESSKHSAADWKAIVDMMISRGAQLTPSEETTVVNYLAANFGQ